MRATTASPMRAIAAPRTGAEPLFPALVLTPLPPCLARHAGCVLSASRSAPAPSTPAAPAPSAPHSPPASAVLTAPAASSPATPLLALAPSAPPVPDLATPRAIEI
ncbi:hypothetical protein ABZP36_026139 [Zizania latifolia]